MNTVIVGFKCDCENSVYYKKLTEATPLKIGNCMFKAYLKGADFVSVRFIKIKESDNQEQIEWKPKKTVITKLNSKERD